ncbi:MAG TPA: YCF48-related protein [Aliidongia sp.]|uniref:WD40/YVTN/BNR-like repeat-containing protein n=1 Tax=Aliidongia sp. TaxID=1914230 RepID=UPI002DDDA496|nr:YCF48-related protein [Aliidongia sp.]HEV2677625.1 YCF48-related protein [Aliidongia sp.]
MFANLFKGASLVAVLLLGCGAAAAEDHPPIPAEIVPLAAQSLLLGVARAGSALVAVGEHGIILLSHDDGTSWVQQPSPVDVLLTAVSFAGDKHGLVVGHDGTVLRTNDGGQHWQLIERDLDAGPLLTVALASDGLHGVAGGAYGLLLVTADGGASWQPAKLPDADDDGADSHLYAAAIAAADRWVVVGEAGRILVSGDQGTTWRVVKASYAGSFFGITAKSADDWLVFGLEGKMLETADAGATWRPIETGQSSGLTSAALLEDGRLIAVGLNGTILVEDGAGGHFLPRHLKTPTALTAVLPVDGVAVLLGERGASRLDAATLRAAP